MSYRFADSLRAVSGRIHPDPARKLSADMCDIYHCCVYSEKNPDDGQRNCPKHVEFYSKNKFEKIMHLVDFIIRNVIAMLLVFFVGVSSLFLVFLLFTMHGVVHKCWLINGDLNRCAVRGGIKMG